MFESLKKKLKQMFSISKESKEEIVHEKPEEEHVKLQESIAEETSPKEQITEEGLAVPEKKQAVESILGKAVKKITEKKLGEKEADAILEKLKITLVENDVAFEVAEKICMETERNIIGKDVSRMGVEQVVKQSLAEAVKAVMHHERPDLERMIENKQGVFTIMVFGSNGAGKTTTIAKLAAMYKKYRPVVAAGDTFRAASIEQLSEHSKKAGFDLIKHSYGADSAAVIFDARKHAEARGSKIVIADTAGRSHSNMNLMDELKKVARVNNPDMKILVLDALTGNDIYMQAKTYDNAVGVDAIILTKTDVYDKGGACLSASYVIKKPILFLGTGQDYNDLEKFDEDKIVKNLIG